MISTYSTYTPATTILSNTTSLEICTSDFGPHNNRTAAISVNLFHQLFIKPYPFLSQNLNNSVVKVDVKPYFIKNPLLLRIQQKTFVPAHAIHALTCSCFNYGPIYGDQQSNPPPTSFERFKTFVLFYYYKKTSCVSLLLRCF